MARPHADALRSMRRIYLDAGRKDEYFLDLGAQAFAAELEALGVEHSLELFDGKHGGLTYRYPGRDPRAGAGAHAVIGRSPSTHQASTSGHGAVAGLGVDVPGAGQHVGGDAERPAVERGGALRAVRVVVRADQPRAAAQRGQRHGEERLDLGHPGGLRRRRHEQQPVGLRAALGDVVQPQQAGERVADDDRLAGRQGGQLAVEHAAPGVRATGGRRRAGRGRPRARCRPSAGPSATSASAPARTPPGRAG